MGLKVMGGLSPSPALLPTPGLGSAGVWGPAQGRPVGLLGGPGRPRPGLPGGPLTGGGCCRWRRRFARRMHRVGERTANGETSTGTGWTASLQKIGTSRPEALLPRGACPIRAPSALSGQEEGVAGRPSGSGCGLCPQRPRGREPAGSAPWRERRPRAERWPSPETPRPRASGSCTSPHVPLLLGRCLRWKSRRRGGRVFQAEFS